ncbi:MAG: hypothetical protein BRD38_04500, partial [Bacteroidetes bacterium QH_9_67_14]
MKAFLRLSLCFALTALLGAVPAAAPVCAQDTGVIAGQVTEDATGQAIPGVNVRIPGTDLGAATDAEGRFRITGVPVGTYTVVASFLGYSDGIEENVTVEAGETERVQIAMQKEAQDLDEVVVVAYGEQQRGDVTGATATVESETIEATATSSFQQALQGTVAGVKVTQGDAAPGAGISVQIRGITSTTGSSEPLYVVDGVPLNTSGVPATALGPNKSLAGTDQAVGSDTNPLATISPSDVESIRVLKDASATALYGSRAANGVVLITTKDGRGQNNVSIEYERSYSTPVRTIDMLDAGPYARYVNQAQLNAGNNVVYGSGT